jgi:hypothetical protein
MKRFTIILRSGIVLQVDGENIADFYDLKGMGGHFKVTPTDMGYVKIRKQAPFNPMNVTAVQFHERDIIAIFTEEW